MIRIISSLCLFCLLPIYCIADEAQNVALVRGMIDTVNQRDLDDLDRFVAADIVRHSAATPGVVVSNIEEFKNFLRADFASTPDSVQEIEIIFGSDDYVAVKASLSGTQTGPFGPFPPSGKSMKIPFMGILRIEGGRIAEIWVEWDNLNALTQLGHFPPGSDENQ